MKALKNNSSLSEISRMEPSSTPLTKPWHGGNLPGSMLYFFRKGIRTFLTQEEAGMKRYLIIGACSVFDTGDTPGFPASRE